MQEWPSSETYKKKIKRQIMAADMSYLTIIKVQKPKTTRITQHAFGRTFEITEDKNVNRMTKHPDSLDRGNHVLTSSNFISTNINRPRKLKKSENVQKANRELKKRCGLRSATSKPTGPNGNKTIVKTAKSKPQILSPPISV